MRMTVSRANTGAETWRYMLPCGHRGGRRQVTFRAGHPKAWRCRSCETTHAYRTDLKTGRRVP